MKIRTVAVTVSTAAAALVALAGQATAETPADPAPAGQVVIVQESNGFPGGEQTSRLARQRVAVRGDRLRILDLENQWVMWVDLGAKTVSEGEPVTKQYVERSFDELAKYRDQREKSLASAKDEFLRMKGRVEDEPAELRSLIDAYRRAGGDPDQPGQIVARLQHYPQDQKKTVLIVDDEEREVTLEHYVIRENQADVPIFDLWTTTDVAIPVDVFRFYRQLGAFSAPVSARLQQVEGTIVGCTAVLDNGSLKKTFRSRVLEIRTHEAPTGPLVRPDGWTVRTDSGEPGATPKDAVTCAMCGKEIARDAAHVFREPWGKRRTFYLCSAQHRRDLVRKLAAERRKQR